MADVSTSPSSAPVVFTDTNTTPVDIPYVSPQQDATSGTPTVTPPYVNPQPDGAGTPSPSTSAPSAAAPAQASAPQTPQQAASQGSQGTTPSNSSNSGTPAPQKQPDLSKAPTGTLTTPSSTAPAPENPQLHKAGRIFQMAQMLTGGPQYRTTIDPNTGDMIRTQVPVSKGHIAMALALEAISGGLVGLGQMGPNATGMAGAAGVEEGMKIGQMRKEDQAQQDQEAQQTYARKVQIFQNNLRTAQIGRTLSAQDLDYNQKIASQAQPMYDGIMKIAPQQILGTGTEQDMISKYHATNENAIMTGRVIPVMDPKTGKQAVGPAGNLLTTPEYAAINPNFKSSDLISPENWKLGQVYGITPKGLPDNPVLGFSMALELQNKIIAASMADKTVQDFYKSMGEEAPNFASMVKSNPSLARNVESFQPLLNATGGNVGHAISELATGDPKNGRAPDPGAAGNILNLFGGWKNVNAYDQKNANDALAARTAAEKTAQVDAGFSVIDSVDKANAVLANPSHFSQNQVSQAKDFLSEHNHQIATEKYAGASASVRGKADAEKAAGITPGNSSSSSNSGQGSSNESKFFSPAVNATLVQANYNTSDGRNEAFLQAFAKDHPELAKLVKAYSDGLNLPSYYQNAKEYGALLSSAMESYDPSFNISAAQRYNKTMQELSPGGKAGSKIIQANTAFMHAANLYYDIGGASAIGFSGKYNADYVDAYTEMANAYANGSQATDDQKEAMRKALTADRGYPVQRAAVKRQMRDLNDKTSAIFRQELDGLPRGVQLPPGVIDLAVAMRVHPIIGERIDPRMIKMPDGRGAMMTPGVSSQFIEAITQRPLDPKNPPTQQEIQQAVHLAKQRGWRFPSDSPGPQASVQPHPSASFPYVSPSGEHGWNGKEWVPIQPNQQATNA